MTWAFLPGRARRALGRLLRRIRRVEGRVVRLPPLPGGEPVGRLLLSYVVDPFLLRDPARISWAHTQDWESWAMARVWRELGFAVDAIHWTNSAFRPAASYDLLVDARTNLERLSGAVGERCVKVFHAETAHWRVNDDAQRRRLAELEARRGIRLDRLRLVGENRAIETADCAVVLGGEWTLASYRPFGRPLFQVPISNAFTYPSPADRDFERSRGRFLWFGGVGFVHKGLDLVLDALAGEEGLALDVAAPLDREPDFAAAYRRELYGTANVRALGWLDVATPRFLETARESAAMVFPSCSEGGGGSAITAMHAGLIPVLTFETSVDLEPAFGLLLPDASVGTLRTAARELAGRPATQLRSMAVAAWQRANERHTRATFLRDYRATALAILERFRPDLRARIAE